MWYSFLLADCQQLLRSILVVDPAQRATLAEVVKHRWVRGSQIDAAPLVLAGAGKTQAPTHARTSITT